MKVMLTKLLVKWDGVTPCDAHATLTLQAVRHFMRQVSQTLSHGVSHQRGQLSLVDAARRLGIGRSTLYRYLNGEVAWPADLLAKWEGATPGTTSGTLGGTVSGTSVPASPSLPSPSPSSPSSPSHTLPLTPPPATPLSQPSPEGEGARTRKKTKTDTTDVLLDPGSLGYCVPVCSHVRVESGFLVLWLALQALLPVALHRALR